MNMKAPTLQVAVSVIATALLGVAAGTVNGLLGAAGGILLVAVLPRLPIPAFLTVGTQPLSAHTDRRDIFATALCAMLPVSAVSAFLYWRGGIQTDPALLVTMILPAALGGLVGALLLEKIPRTLLRRLFALVVVISGLRMLF